MRFLLLTLFFAISPSLAKASDSDSDGLPDAWEILNSLDPFDGSTPTEDPDVDGLTNLAEFLFGTNPHDSDTDNDNLLDGVETNTGSYTSPSDTGTDPLRADSDDDGLLDGEEINYSTNPFSPDTDGDDFNDGLEVRLGHDPNNNENSPPALPASLTEDLDADGYSALTEYFFGTSDSTPNPSLAILTLTEGSLIYSFPRTPSAFDATWSIEVSDDSDTWSDEPTTYTVQPPVDLLDGRVQESVIFKTSFTKKFIRLKITTP